MGMTTVRLCRMRHPPRLSPVGSLARSPQPGAHPATIDHDATTGPLYAHMRPYEAHIGLWARIYWAKHIEAQAAAPPYLTT
mgnify:CR=1 FL=1